MNKKLWVYIFLLWQFGGLVVTAIFSVSAGGFHHFTHELIMVLTFTNTIGLGVVAVIFFHLFVLRKKMRIPELQYLISIVLVGLVIYFGSDFALKVGAEVCGIDSYKVGQLHLVTIIINFVMLTMATVFAVLLLLYRRISENLENKIHENTELSRLQLETKFALLQSKVNPHFLFNTLNSMLDVLEKDPDKIEVMIMNLADIYHKTLTLPDRSTISLDDELELVKEYLEIEKIRMGDRLEYRFQVKEQLRQTKIPPMMIQILVENAIRHGLTPKKEGGTIDINIDEVDGEKIAVSVNDTGVGIVQRESYSGYGLTCIKQQLKLLYSAKAKMNISLAPTGGTLVCIELPYDT